MAIQKKHGKGRLDKWYRLAKEKGYRARAAFKLIQLNRKYGFLEQSKVLLDLCAAPGSWCQVAAETMPANSIIIGVDLAPIKPIPRTITFQSDITTDKCRATIRSHLKTWKADTVLHDGAPNVGTAWVQDAFSQAELVHQAMKLATEFLKEGGTFVTKVFRSKDYNALLWVFSQLFDKVEATKPPSSRNVSAEIFVVCRGYKAPGRIDPRFLDSRSVFAELSGPTINVEAKVFNPEKKKRKRDGYDEGDYIQFKEVPVVEFIRTTDPISMLGSFNKLSFNAGENDDSFLIALQSLPETTAEVRHCCSDLKVLGRKEFRMLLRWRLKARQIFELSTQVRTASDLVTHEVVDVTPLDDEDRLQEDLKNMEQKHIAEKKKDRRRENERRQRQVVRMQLHMLPPTEIGLEQTGPDGEDSMFAIGRNAQKSELEKISRGKMYTRVPESTDQNSSDSDEESDDEANDLDQALDDLYEQYQERKSMASAKHRSLKARKEHGDGDWTGFSDEPEASSDEYTENDSSDVSDQEDQYRHPTEGNTSPVRGNVLTTRASKFFESSLFKEIDGLDLEEDPLASASGAASTEHPSVYNDRPRNPTPESCERIHNSKDVKTVALSSKAPSADIKPRLQPGRHLEHGDEIEVVKNTGESDWEKNGASQQDGQLDIDIITAEAMTLAQQVATGQKSGAGLVDDGFNKYSFQDRDGLPEWFLDDEQKHSRPLRPITAAAAAAVKEKLRVMNARPIKKVREAKDRKRLRTVRRLEKLRKKSALLADEEGMSEKDKAQTIAKLMKKGMKRKPRQQVKLVVARGGNRGISGRPRGVKGKYKIVDARLKKDVRAERRISKKKR